ncbi:MAG: ATP-binding protein [Saprospiraceae bacterium]|nr:ATP-binding protein [Saprospiraceae bacterium]
MYLKRNIDNSLIDWKISDQRKPLLLRGARQVGKTSTVRNLAKSFSGYIEINFDERPEFSQIFETSTSVESICEKISVLTSKSIVEGETLLFLDEIQSCIPAISMLRYFYEKKPRLHVIAAGSLLEFALAEIPSFGVGRIRSIFMYPLSYSEFLSAMDEDSLRSFLSNSDIGKPIAEPIHKKAIELYKKFIVIGGMPEAIMAYVTKNDILEVQHVINDLVISFQTDFVKYKNRVPSARLREVYDSIAMQMGSKFSYSYPNATLNNAQIKDAIELLKMAGLVVPVTHTAAKGIPLGAEINPKKTKYLILDTGILQRIMGLNISDLLLSDHFDTINKGSIAELHVGLELIKMQNPMESVSLYYWQREAKNSQAEVDYVIQNYSKIIPVEVKAATKGSMQSLFLFLKEKNLYQGVRFSLENFGQYDKILSIPLYAIDAIKKLR